jgi:hypothetical protein
MTNRATLPGGPLTEISKCYIDIPNYKKIVLNNLPNITDAKSAQYNDEAVIGRSMPLKTYSHSENRSISMQLHFFITEEKDVEINLKHLRALESAVYPRDEKSGANAPFVPPPICRIRCGDLLSTEDICCILKQYSVTFPTDVSWDDTYFTPYKFDVDTQWEVVYKTADLPGQHRILISGR